MNIQFLKSQKQILVNGWGCFEYCVGKRVKKAENHCFKVRNYPIYSFAGLLINFEWCNKTSPWEITIRSSPQRHYQYYCEMTKQYHRE